MFDVERFVEELSAPDPYPLYDSLRERGRVLWVEELDRWFVTGYQEAAEILGHDHVSSDRSRWAGYELPEGYDRPPGGLFVMDPPEHTHQRGLVRQAFSPRMIEAMRPTVAGLVDGMLAEAHERGEFDLMSDLAAVLPAVVFAGMLGLPADEHDMFRRWTMTYIEAIDPVSHLVDSPEGIEAGKNLDEYLLAAIAERRARPREDLISALIRIDADIDLGADLLELCTLLTVAGVETTGNLIGNGVNALLDFPDQLALLRSDPSLIGSAIEEMLRYDAPTPLSGRVPLRPIELGGQRLEPNQMVGVFIGGANRDPLEFSEPNRLDITRSPNRHLSFSRGIHHCVGSALARLQGSIAINALVRRFPHLRRAGDPVHRPNFHVRGFVSLPVAAA